MLVFVLILEAECGSLKLTLRVSCYSPWFFEAESLGEFDSLTWLASLASQLALLVTFLLLELRPGPYWVLRFWSSHPHGRLFNYWTISSAPQSLVNIWWVTLLLNLWGRILVWKMNVSLLRVSANTIKSPASWERAGTVHCELRKVKGSVSMVSGCIAFHTVVRENKLISQTMVGCVNCS